MTFDAGKAIRTFGLVLGLVCASLLGYSIYEQIAVEHHHIGLYADDASVSTSTVTVDGGVSTDAQ